MPNRSLCLLMLAGLFPLVGCGRSDDASQIPQAESPSVKETSREADHPSAEHTDPANEPQPPQAGEPLDNPAGESPSFPAGPATLTGTARLATDGEKAEYKLTLLGELGLPLINWSGTLGFESSEIELYEAPGGQSQQGVAAASLTLLVEDDYMSVYGSIIGDDDAIQQFYAKFTIVGFVPPEPEPEPQPEYDPDDNWAGYPMAEFLGNDVRGPMTRTEDLFAILPLPESQTEQWFVADNTASGLRMFSYQAVKPTADGVVYESRLFSSSGWYQIAIAQVNEQGYLTGMRYTSGLPDNYTMLAYSEPKAGDFRFHFREFARGNEAEDFVLQHHTQPDPRHLEALPIALEKLTFDYHLAEGHDRFLIETSDFTAQAGVINYILYERQEDREIEIDGQAVTARVYRQRYTSEATSDRIQSDQFGQVATATLYCHPEGTWIKVVADDFEMRLTTIEEAAEALQLSDDELLRPVPEVESD